MILIDPLPLLPTQQPHIDQLPTHRHHSHMLESQIRLIAKTMLRLHFLGHDDILDPDPEIAVLVVARLIGQHVAGGQGDLAVLDARADPDGTLVDVEVRPDAVPGAVPVVEALLPEELAREGVEREAGRAFGEDGGVERDDAFEDQSVGRAFQGRWGAEVQGPRRVGGAVQVLGAGVAEVDGGGVDDGAVARFGFVVDDGCVGARGGDGVEGEAGEVVFRSGCISCQMTSLFDSPTHDLRPYGLKLVSRLDFIELCPLFHQLFFQPCKVLAQRCPVSDMTSTHPFQLRLVLDGFSITY